MVRSLTPPQAARNALAIAVHRTWHTAGRTDHWRIDRILDANRVQETVAAVVRVSAICRPMQQTEDTVSDLAVLQLEKSDQFDTLMGKTSQCDHLMKGIRLE